MKSDFAMVALAFSALAIGSASLSAQIPAAQPQNSAATTPAGPALMVRSDKVLESFEPPADEEYRLGAGDDITLDVTGHTDVAGEQVIGPDGMITVPVIGSVRVADLTRLDAANAISTALSRYYNEPSVTVRINKYASNRVRVIGYVQHPGEILFEGQPTLLDAISRAGLISPIVTANGISTSIGPGIPEICTIYRGNSTAVQVNLRELLMSGNALADMRLRRNDIVFVPEPKQLFVSVLGQVAKPGSIALGPESTLTSVLADAGCCADNGGFNPTIHILQRSTGNDVKIEYKKLLTLEGQKEFTLHPGDVIFVPVSTFSKVTATIQKISPIATMASLVAFVGAG